MNERDFAKRVTSHLNYGVNQLDRGVLLRLQALRQQALALHARPRQGMSLAWAGGSGAESCLGAGQHHGSLRFWWSLAALLVCLLVVAHWQDLNGDEADEVDAVLLAEDLPVHAYLDSDFDTWLEQSSLQ